MRHKVVCRAANIEDINAIRQLYLDVITENPDTLFQNNPDLVTFDFIRNITCGSGSIALVLEHNYKVVGVGGCQIKDHFRYRHVAENYFIIIDKQYQKFSYGMMLLKECIAEGQRQNIAIVQYGYPVTNFKTAKVEKILTILKYKFVKTVIKDGVYLTTGKKCDMNYVFLDIAVNQKPKNTIDFKNHILLFLSSPCAYILKYTLWRLVKLPFKQNNPIVIKIETFCTKYKKLIFALFVIYAIFNFAKYYF